MAITGEMTVVASHIHWPLRLYGRVVYRLLTEHGDFVSATNPPDIFDANGAPTTLMSEIASGSIVRVRHSGHGAMSAVQLVNAKFENPFARCWLSLAVQNVWYAWVNRRAPQIPPQIGGTRWVGNRSAVGSERKRSGSKKARKSRVFWIIPSPSRCPWQRCQ